jgi:glycosyltransferase involved in cell wall biosynthesis
MERTDLLLLTMTNDISLPGKLFEYMATGKPILALTPQGSEVHRILQETGAGWCVDPGDTAKIQAMLARAYDSVRAGVKIVAEDRAMVRRYERPRLAAEYGKLIGELFGPAAIAASSKELPPPALMKSGRAPATHSDI